MIPPQPPFYVRPPVRPWWLKVARVLWVAIPVFSLGFLAWVPSLGTAIRRPVSRNWFAFVGFLVGTVVEVMLAATFQTTDSRGQNTITWPVGLYLLAFVVVASVHAGMTTRSARGPVPPAPYFGGAPAPYPGGYGPNGGYPLYQQYDTPPAGYRPMSDTPPTGWPQTDTPPIGYRSVDAVPPGFRPVPPVQSVQPVQPAAPAPDADAAEVQAGLRELRESLERGEGRDR